MTVGAHGAHYDEGACWAYALGALEPDAAAELERHMADCDECAALVGQIFDKTGEAECWGAAMHGRVWRRERLRICLATALGAAEGALKKALETWRGARSALVEGFARAEVGEGGLSWVTGGLSPGPAVAGIKTRGYVRKRGGVRPRPGASRWIELRDGSRAAVNVEGDSVVVRFPGRSRNTPPPPVLLAPDDEAEAPQATLAAWDDFQRQWVSMLRLPRGGFEVVVGPAANGV